MFYTHATRDLLTQLLVSQLQSNQTIELGAATVWILYSLWFIRHNYDILEIYILVLRLAGELTEYLKHSLKLTNIS